MRNRRQVKLVGLILLLLATLVIIIVSLREQSIDTLNEEQQLFDFFTWSNSTSCRLSHDFGGKIGLLGIDGQKAVCMDPQVRPKPGDCIVYSFGIKDDWTFEQVMEEYGCRVFAFDPSINRTDEKRSDKILYFNLGLGAKDEMRKDWHLQPLSAIYRRLAKEQHGQRVIDYLKLDVEMEEWKALPQILQSGMMKRVRQLAVEIHLPERYTLQDSRQLAHILRSLEDNQMVRFDSKINPYSEVALETGRPGYWAFEIAWYNHQLKRDDNFFYVN